MDLLTKNKLPKLTFYYFNESSKQETFFDTTQFHWSAIIELNWKIIRDEIMIHLQQHENKFGAYFADELVNEPGKWRSFGFYFWGISLPKKDCLPFSKTIHILKNVPDIVSASVSIMEPQSEIKPHFGETDAIYRCHLPLVVPDKLPQVGFQVGYEQRNWEEGKLLAFNDAAYHKGWNYTSERRIVLIFDVIKPSLKNKKKWICSKALASIALQKVFFLKRIFLPFIKPTHITFSIYQWLKISLAKQKYL